jgi:hypothetical protein
MITQDNGGKMIKKLFNHLATIILQKAEIDDFDREIELTRKNKALMKLLDERGKQTKTFKAAEVRAQLGLM